jgi:hypothetical protein
MSNILQTVKDRLATQYRSVIERAAVGDITEAELEQCLTSGRTIEQLEQDIATEKQRIEVEAMREKLLILQGELYRANGVQREAIETLSAYDNECKRNRLPLEANVNKAKQVARTLQSNVNSLQSKVDSYTPKVIPQVKFGDTMTIV